MRVLADEIPLYLGIPLATQNLATHSGGVVDLDRDYEGAGLHLTREGTLLGAPVTILFGGDVETMKERRKGFINNGGWIAALKRNEDNYANTTGLLVPGRSV